MKSAAAVLFLILAQGVLSAQDFTKYFQDSADIQTAKQLLAGRENAIWMGGTRGISGQNSRAWVYRLSQQGGLIKKISFPDTREQVWVGMDSLDDGIAAVIGLQEFGGSIRYYLSIIRGDSLSSWRPLPALDNAVLDDVRPAAGRRLLICGFRSSPGIAGNDFFAARIQIDSAKTDWTFQDGYGPNDHISMAKELPDGSVLFCGTVADQGNNYNSCIGKLDSAGNQLWLNVVNTSWNDGAQKFTVAENGDVWLVGESSTSTGSFFDTEIFRFNQSGELLWQQWLGSPGQDAAFLIERKKMSEGFWVAGYSNAGSNGNGPISPFLMSLDASGNSLGEAFWSMNAPSPVYSMLSMSDSVFYFCGISDNKAFLLRRSSPPFESVFVVKVRGFVSENRLRSRLQDCMEDILSGNIQAESLKMVDLLGRVSSLNPVCFTEGICPAIFPSHLFRITWINEKGEQKTTGFFRMLP